MEDIELNMATVFISLAKQACNLRDSPASDFQPPIKTVSWPSWETMAKESCYLRLFHSIGGMEHFCCFPAKEPPASCTDPMQFYFILLAYLLVGTPSAAGQRGPWATHGRSLRAIAHSPTQDLLATAGTDSCAVGPTAPSLCGTQSLPP